MADDPINPGGGEEEGAPEWMVTFADMMSLLLTFFILLLSFASMDVERFKALADSMRESFTFNGLPIPGKSRPASNAPGKPEAPRITAAQISDPSTAQISTQDQVNRQRLQEVKQQIDAYITSADLELFIQTELTGNGLLIVNSDPLSFPPGGASLEENSVKYLEALLPALARYDYDVIIEGHTDNMPIQTAEFPSNWELSTARASRFARYLIDRGIAPDRLSVTGYAEFNPVVPNDTEENRARNRRIEILLKYDSDDSSMQMP